MKFLLMILLLSINVFADNNASHLLNGKSLEVSFDLKAINDDVDDYHMFGLSYNDLEVKVGVTCVTEPDSFFQSMEYAGEFEIPMVKKGETESSDGKVKIYYADIERCDDMGGSLQISAEGDLADDAPSVAISSKVIKEVLEKGVSQRTVKGEHFDHRWPFIIADSEFELTMKFNIAE
jgi:hypothetical protein